MWEALHELETQTRAAVFDVLGDPGRCRDIVGFRHAESRVDFARYRGYAGGAEGVAGKLRR